MVLPFVNRKCKIRARVVDFFPEDLQEFASSLDDIEYNDVQRTLTSSAVTPEVFSSDQSRNPWEWAFFLQLEEVQGPAPPAGQARPRLRVLVSHHDAEHLLKLSACDLRREKNTLNELREKLFILWGDLEEIKQAGELEKRKPSGQPFDCWIQEYGVPAGDGEWERMFKMEWTTIQ